MPAPLRFQRKPRERARCPRSRGHALPPQGPTGRPKTLAIEAHERAIFTFRSHFLDELIAEGHTITVAAPRFTQSQRRLLKRKGIRPRRFFLSRRSTNPLKEVLSVVMLSRILMQESADIVYCFGPKPVMYGGLALRMLRTSPHGVAVITGLGIGFNANSRGIVPSLQRHLYRRALPSFHRIIFQNSDDNDLFHSMGLIPPDSLTDIVRGSGVDTDSYPQWPLQSPPISFVFVGRFLKSKGLVELLRAARSLHQSGADFRLRLVGWHDLGHSDSITEAELSGLVDGLPEVELCGHLSDVRDALANSHVFILPSHREGLSRSTLEAMSMGRAIITSNAPGCRDVIVDGESGIVVPVKDVAKLTEAMEVYISSPKLVQTHGVAARTRARALFDVRAVTGQLIAHAWRSSGAGTGATPPPSMHSQPRMIAAS
ncbi:glycosyltransferase family 4 protein, partial [Ornithinimicrobium kibberense]